MDSPLIYLLSLHDNTSGMKSSVVSMKQMAIIRVKTPPHTHTLTDTLQRHSGTNKQTQNSEDSE